MEERSKYQVMPPLSDEEYEALKASIAKAGRIFNPIIKDGEGNIIDGHNRARALDELGIPNDHRVGETHLRDLTEPEARMLARRLNLGRRHLSREQIAQVVLDVKAEHPRWSARKISAELGGLPTAKRVLEIIDSARPTVSGKQLDAVSAKPKAESLDGKSRPATKEAVASQRNAIKAVLQQEPVRSNRSVAADLGCSPSTVAAVRSTIAENRVNGNGQPKSPEKPVTKRTGPTGPALNPADRHDAVDFAKELEGVLARALTRRPEAFVELLPPKRQDVLLPVLKSFCAWAQAAQTGDTA